MKTAIFESRLEFIDDLKWLPKSYLILISGKIGTGKTTAAKILRSLLSTKGYTSEIRGFAYDVKKVALQSFRWDGKKDKKGRKLLQDIGNTGRTYNENIWCESLINHIEDSLFISDVYIVDDWRFPNELKYVKDSGTLNVITVRIESDVFGNYKDRDVSEVSLPLGYVEPDYYDFVIYNNDSLEDLKDKLYTIVETIEKLEE